MAGENLLVVDDSPTILKVVESALTRAGYQVDTAVDAGAALNLARSRKPALILIDSLIGGHSLAAPAASGVNGNGNGNAGKRSKANGRAKPTTEEQSTGGFRLCGVLAADAALAGTPVVLMTAKGEDLEGRYSLAPNVIDYITKPFSPEAILAVVTHVIEKTGTSARGMAGSGEKAAAAEIGEARGPVRSRTGPNAVAQALSQSMGPPLPDAFGRLRDALAEHLERYRQESGSWAMPTITAGALTDDVLASMLADAGFEATEGGEAGPDLAGHLGAISLSEVITLLGQQSQTGTLRVLTESSRVELFFNRGALDLAAAVGVAEEFLLGRFAVESGHLTSDSLAHVLDERARVTGKPPLFGRDLTARGLLTPEQLKGIIRRQTAELAYEALRWAQGSFQFRRSDELPDLAQDAALGISVDTLLLEGFRRIDEWRLIERDIQSFDLVFMRAEDRIADLPRGTLTRDEIAVLDALSGKNSVRDLVRSLRMGSFDVSKILYRLLRTKLIRRRVQPVATL